MWVDRRSGTNEKGGLEDATNYSFNTYHITLAAWTLRPTLHKESGPKKLGANFEHFWVAKWPQGLQIGLPNLMVSIFQPWGQYKAIKFSIY